MRWGRFAATLPTDDYSDLVNYFTAGRGYLQIAAHLADTNGAAPAVLAQVGHAVRYLTAVGEQVARLPRTETRAAPELADSTPVRELPWRSFLATRPPEVAGALSQALRDTQRVAAIIIEDGEVTALQHHLAASLACLERLLRAE